MIFNAGHIVITTSEENGNVLLQVQDRKLLFANQDEQSIQALLLGNFEKVRNHYRQKGADKLTGTEYDELSLNIVLHYLYMYNMWRGLYKGQENKQLEFDKEDYHHPQTHDEIIRFVKRKYPGDYIHRGSALMEMSEGEFRDYEKRRKEFHDKF
jgi:hypothetical protein